jgi:hypothetical protein
MLSMSAEAPRLECAPSMRAIKTTPTASLSSECKVEVSRVDRAHRRDGEASVRWERKPPLGVRDARNNEYHGCARRRVGEAAGTGGAAAGLPASYSSAANQREAVHSSDGLTVSPINFLKGRKQTDYLADSLDLPIRSVLLLANHNR